MVVSIHQYELTDETTHEAFRAAIEAAERRGLFDLPGLIEYQSPRGIKGTRREGYTAVWTYESREAWAELWAPVENLIPKAEYPASWRTWEEMCLIHSSWATPTRLTSLPTTFSGPRGADRDSDGTQSESPTILRPL